MGSLLFEWVLYVRGLKDVWLRIFVVRARSLFDGSIASLQTMNFHAAYVSISSLRYQSLKF